MVCNESDSYTAIPFATMSHYLPAIAHKLQLTGSYLALHRT